MFLQPQIQTFLIESLFYFALNLRFKEHQLLQIKKRSMIKTWKGTLFQSKPVSLTCSLFNNQIIRDPILSPNNQKKSRNNSIKKKISCPSSKHSNYKKQISKSRENKPKIPPSTCSPLFVGENINKTPCFEQKRIQVPHLPPLHHRQYRQSESQTQRNYTTNFPLSSNNVYKFQRQPYSKDQKRLNIPKSPKIEQKLSNTSQLSFQNQRSNLNKFKTLQQFYPKLTESLISNSVEDGINLQESQILINFFNPQAKSFLNNSKIQKCLAD